MDACIREGADAHERAEQPGERGGDPRVHRRPQERHHAEPGGERQGSVRTGKIDDAVLPKWEKARRAEGEPIADGDRGSGRDQDVLPANRGERAAPLVPNERERGGDESRDQERGRANCRHAPERSEREQTGDEERKTEGREPRLHPRSECPQTAVDRARELMRHIGRPHNDRSQRHNGEVRPSRIDGRDHGKARSGGREPLFPRRASARAKHVIAR